MPWSLLGCLTQAPRACGLAPDPSLLASFWLSEASSGLPLPPGLCTHPPLLETAPLHLVSACLSDTHLGRPLNTLPAAGKGFEVTRAPVPGCGLFHIFTLGFSVQCGPQERTSLAQAGPSRPARAWLGVGEPAPPVVAGSSQGPPLDGFHLELSTWTRKEWPHLIPPPRPARG